MPRTRNPYPAAFREQIVELHRAGRSAEDLAREFEPCVATIHIWIRQADRDGGRRADILADNGSGADFDPDGDDLTVTLVSGPAQGTLVLNNDGTFSYEADAEMFDLATTGDVFDQSFTYQIDDGNGVVDHSPWQRGGIENANGLIRRDLPRKTNLSDYTDDDIDDVTWNLNLTPRKCLGYRTPIEAFAPQPRCRT